MKTFHEYLQERDPELVLELKKALGIAGAMGTSMVGGLAGGAAGLLAGGPLAAIPGFVGGKILGNRVAKRLFPRGVLNAKMKKKSKKSK